MIDKVWLEAAGSGDLAAMKALADQYEENGDRVSAAKWREKAGLSRIVYQVYNTNTGNIEREYKIVRACNAYICGMTEAKTRNCLKIRMMEVRLEEVAAIESNLSRPRAFWKGQVEVVKGDFVGKTGEVVGWTRQAGGNYPYRVKIDDNEHVIDRDHVKFL